MTHRTRSAAPRNALGCPVRRGLAHGRLLTLVLTLLTASSAVAQTARLRVEVDSVRVGEPFEAVLRVEGTPGGDFLIPSLGPVGDGAVEVLSGDAGVEAPTLGEPSTGVARESVSVWLAVFALDSADVTLPVGFLVRGETAFVATAPVRVRIARLVTDTTGRLRPTLPPESFGWPPWMWALLAAAVLLAAWLFRLWRRRPVPLTPPDTAPDEAPLGPHARLVARLMALGGALPQRPSEARVFFPALVDALRQYLAERFAMSTREMTTSDLVRAVAAGEKTGTYPRGAAEMLRGVLATADLGRYGGACPPAAATRDVLAAARALADHVDAPRPRRAPSASAAATGALPSATIPPAPPSSDGRAEEGARATPGRSRPWPPVPPRTAPPPPAPYGPAPSSPDAPPSSPDSPPA